MNDGRIKIIFIKADGNVIEPTTFKLVLSAITAWFLGFKETTKQFTHLENDNKHIVLYSDLKYPPATIRYLQVICKNACGTTDSNMTMPTTMGIMHVTDHLSLINPHIAVNHRIEKGRIIDIEILRIIDHSYGLLYTLNSSYLKVQNMKGNKGFSLREVCMRPPAHSR